jgi:preprotein translocase subunit SecF
MPAVEVELRTGLRCECGVMVLSFARFINLSALVTLLVTTLLLATKGLNFAVDFAGGMIIEVHYPWAVASKSVQDTLVQAGLADASVKEINGYPSNFLIVFPPTAEVLSPQSHVVQQVTAALRTKLPSVEAPRVEIVSPEVAGEVLLLGPTPLILVYVAIMIYSAVRYGWRVGLSLAATNIRNIAIILGLFLSTYIVFQWEFSLLSMTAMDALAIFATGAGTVYAQRLTD